MGLVSALIRLPFSKIRYSCLYSQTWSSASPVLSGDAFFPTPLSSHSLSVLWMPSLPTIKCGCSSGLHPSLFLGSLIHHHGNNSINILTTFKFVSVAQTSVLKTGTILCNLFLNISDDYIPKFLQYKISITTSKSFTQEKKIIFPSLLSLQKIAQPPSNYWWHKPETHASTLQLSLPSQLLISSPLPRSITAPKYLWK